MRLAQAVVAVVIGSVSATVAHRDANQLPPTVPVIPATTFQTVGPILTHTGPFDSRTRADPTLNFFEKYVHSIETLNLTNQYPNFYAPNSTFYNANGTAYVGGPAIATFIEGLFTPFNKIIVNEHVHRVIPFAATPALGDEGANNAQDKINSELCMYTTKCNWIFTEHDFIFFLSPPLDGPGIPVRRSMTFLAGPAQVAGQGTDGLQWYEVKVWWDEVVLLNEISRRKNAKPAA